MILTLTPSGHLVMIGQDVLTNDAAVPFRAEAVKQAFAISPAAGIIALAGEKAVPDWPLFLWITRLLPLTGVILRKLKDYGLRCGRRSLSRHFSHVHRINVPFRKITGSRAHAREPVIN